ncbi:hypothetical protein GGR52DRAFT_572660 [Hypoxylon sp. FL1284]|nr:hypothetical protein GGR52DRAFT_572660 [Hypoxylon sp. FL1284]
MKCRCAATISLLAGLLTGVMAGGGIVEGVQRDLDSRSGMFVARAEDIDFQRFKDSIQGEKAGAILPNFDNKRPFKTDQDSSDNPGSHDDFRQAANSICDNQHNRCADAINNSKDKDSLTVTVGDCDAQNEKCKKANNPTDQDDDFLYFCDDEEDRK